MSDYEKLRLAIPKFVYELLEENDKQKFKFNLSEMSQNNLFQYYRQIVGNPIEHCKNLREYEEYIEKTTR